jgi:PrtD family type I secretion system ABC transporter
MKWLFAGRLRPFVLLAAGASFILNLALLVPSLYMLQVFDRVFASRSEETLAMLTLLASLALVLGYFADSTRAAALACAGRALDRFLSPLALEKSLLRAAVEAGRNETEALRDIAQLRAFLSGNGVLALFDAPWLPLYLLIITAMHPLLGALALCGALTLIALAAATDRLTRKHAEAATLSARAAAEKSQALIRNAEVIVGMGMSSAAVTQWRDRHEKNLLAQERLSGVATKLGALAKMGRQALQIAMLCLGAYLVIDSQGSPGIMIAATILLGRALQPVEQLIGGWKSMIDARGAWSRLNERPAPAIKNATPLPTPIGHLQVERLTYAVTQTRPALLKGVSFQLGAGESLGVIGPSAAGKTTLIRLLLGLLQPQGGIVRLDGADIARWDRDVLGKHIGYVPQGVELFSGTVAENIARLGTVYSERVIEAAQLAHAHEMILRLPEGYDTQIGNAGAALSAGQRQRIALARAVYGNPKLVVLDEPNSNLDAEGEIALGKTLKELKQRSITVVMVGHRSNLMAQLDKLAILRDGALEAFGLSGEVLPRVQGVVRQLHRPPAAATEKQA